MRIESLPAYCETHRGRTDQTLRALPLKLCRAGAGPGEVAGGPWRVERVGPSLTRSCRGAPHWWERVPPDVSPGSGQSTARSLQPIARRVSLGWAPHSGGPQLESQQCPALFMIQVPWELFLNSLLQSVASFNTCRPDRRHIRRLPVVPDRMGGWVVIDTVGE